MGNVESFNIIGSLSNFKFSFPLSYSKIVSEYLDFYRSEIANGGGDFLYK